MSSEGCQESAAGADERQVRLTSAKLAEVDCKAGSASPARRPARTTGAARQLLARTRKRAV